MKYASGPGVAGADSYQIKSNLSMDSTFHPHRGAPPSAGAAADNATSNDFLHHARSHAYR